MLFGVNFIIGHFIIGHFIIGHFIIGHFMLFHVISCHYMSFHVISCHFMSNHVSLDFSDHQLINSGQGLGQGQGQICFPKPSATALLSGRKQKTITNNSSSKAFGVSAADRPKAKEM
jgi:hypothetical protein